MTMALYRLGATAFLTLVLTAAVIACGSRATTQPPGTVPIQTSTASTASTPSPEPIIEGFDPITGAPSTGQPAPSPLAATAPPAPLGKLVWRLSSPDGRAFNAGEELSLTLDLDPQNLAVSGVQVGLNYRGELIQLLEIVPGAILGPDPLVVDNIDKLDQPHEQVLFAMARRGNTVGPTGSGRVALIIMRIRQAPPVHGNVMIWLDRVKLTGGNFQTIGQDAVSWSLSGPG